MKFFISVIFTGILVGGFAGGFIGESTFTLSGAAIGGFVFAVALIGIGAFLNAREKNDPTSIIVNEMMKLAQQDKELIARGETPQRRLIPAHAIKRDVILKAFNKDFQKYVDQINSMAISEHEKDRKLTALKQDFKGQIDNINQFGPDELDKTIAVMKNTRNDFRELEKDVRANRSYPFSDDPL